jgi:hypothetical protein
MNACFSRFFAVLAYEASRMCLLILEERLGAVIEDI